MNEEQSSFWKILNTKKYKSVFPESVIPFSSIIKAPDNLKKRLDFIGLIENKENIHKLQNNLSDGQVLVSKTVRFGAGMALLLKERKMLQ